MHNIYYSTKKTIKTVLKKFKNISLLSNNKLNLNYYLIINILQNSFKSYTFKILLYNINFGKIT